jgi:hypothetical protein
MIRTKARSALFVAVAVLGSGAAIVNCSRAPSSHDDVGSVNVALTLSPGVTINTVTYAITGNGIAQINGSIDVTNATTATALVPGIPANPNPYTVTMDATSTDGMTMCHGTGTFIVSANQTATAGVTLLCHGPGATTGTVAINGHLDNCPTINSFSASALQAQVGFSINIGVVASDLDGDALMYSWTALPVGIGTFGSATSANTTFTCTAVGTTSLSIMVTDGACPDSRVNAIPVTCIALIGGIGGSMGTGGAGTGGVGVGGMGVGGAGTGGMAMGVGGAGTGGMGVGGMGVGGMVMGTGGAGTGGAMMCVEPVSGSPAACADCTTGNCSLAPASQGGTDGCCGLTNPTDIALCTAVSQCYAANSTTCTSSGDPTNCYCGTHPVGCFTPTSMANGPCLAQVQAAAGSTDPNVIHNQLTLPTSPLGRATNLSLCRGSFCSTECAIQ